MSHDISRRALAAGLAATPLVALPAIAASARYFQRVAADPSLLALSPDDDGDGGKEWDAMMKFVSDHGQSLDWLFAGDPCGLICGAARSAVQS